MKKVIISSLLAALILFFITNDKYGDTIASLPCITELQALYYNPCPTPTPSISWSPTPSPSDSPLPSLSPSPTFSPDVSEEPTPSDTTTPDPCPEEQCPTPTPTETNPPGGGGSNSDDDRGSSGGGGQIPKCSADWLRLVFPGDPDCGTSPLPLVTTIPTVPPGTWLNPTPTPGLIASAGRIKTGNNNVIVALVVALGVTSMYGAYLLTRKHV